MLNSGQWKPRVGTSQPLFCLTSFPLSLFQFLRDKKKVVLCKSKMCFILSPSPCWKEWCGKFAETLCGKGVGAWGAVVTWGLHGHLVLSEMLKDGAPNKPGEKNLQAGAARPQPHHGEESCAETKSVWTILLLGGRTGKECTKDGSTEHFCSQLAAGVKAGKEDTKVGFHCYRKTHTLLPAMWLTPISPAQAAFLQHCFSSSNL